MMVLEVGDRRGGGHAEGGDAGVNHKRAALEFVAELTGADPRAGGDKKLGLLEPHNDASTVHADDLPVPIFGVDATLRCAFWNRRATDATGWTEPEVLAMPKFAAALFSNLSDNGKDCEELLQAALEGQDSVQEIWTVKTKWGKPMNAVLMANARTDDTGVVCVIMPLIKTSQPITTLKLAMDLEEQHSRTDQDLFLAALEHPSSPYFDGPDTYGHTLYEAEGSSACSQDWCKSEQSPDSSRGTGSLTRARAMVVDPDARGRKSLNLMLERCGFQVSCVSSGSKALWTFEQSLEDPEGFSIVFVELDSARSDDYALTRQLRNTESSANITTQVVIVALTHLNRWQDSTQKDMSAGLDAIINYPLRVQQLRDTLNSLGVQIDHLDFANKSPRESFNSWNDPLILAR